MSVAKPNRELRSEKLKKSLKAYVVPIVIKHYQVIALRALMENTENDANIWEKRRRMEGILSTEKSIAGFFSCITGIEEKQKNKESKEIEVTVVPGVCFWIFFDWPEHGVDAFEVKVMKLFMESGMSLKRCSIVKPRGK